MSALLMVWSVSNRQWSQAINRSVSKRASVRGNTVCAASNMTMPKFRRHIKLTHAFAVAAQTRFFTKRYLVKRPLITALCAIKLLNVTYLNQLYRTFVLRQH